MPEPVNETIDLAMESVAVGNIKTIAEMAAFTTAQSMKDHVGHSKRLDILAETYLARALKGADEVDTSEAVANIKLLTGNDQAQFNTGIGASLAQVQAQLGAVLGALQQYAKVAQSTPPETATGK